LRYYWIRGSVIRNLNKNKALLLFEAQDGAEKQSTAFIRSARRSGKTKHCFYSKRKAERKNKALLLFEAQGEAAKIKQCFVCSARRSGGLLNRLFLQ